MSKCLFLILFFALIYMCSAAEYNYENTAHKDYPNQCYIESEQKAYKIGVTQPEGECHQIECHSDFSLVKQTCGVVIPPEGYHNEIDHTKPYPECCVKFVKNN